MIAAVAGFIALVAIVIVIVSRGTGRNAPLIKGVNANLLFWESPAWGSQGAAVAADAKSLGVSWTREALNSFTYFDQMLPVAQHAGLRVLPVIPNWPNPADLNGFARFVAESVRRYGPGTRSNLTWFEIWNEPYFSYSWGSTPDPAQYARLYEAAVRAARKVNPRARFLIAAEVGPAPTTTGTAATWIDDVFHAVPSLGGLIDGVSFHGYGDDPALPLARGSKYADVTGGWAFSRIDTARHLMLSHGVSAPFWLTEVGWSTNAMTPYAQARNYRDLIAQVRSRSWIRALFIYNLRDHQPAANPTEGFGLEGSPDARRKPAWRVVQQDLHQLG